MQVVEMCVIIFQAITVVIIYLQARLLSRAMDVMGRFGSEQARCQESVERMVQTALALKGQLEQGGMVGAAMLQQSRKLGGLATGMPEKKAEEAGPVRMPKEPNGVRITMGQGKE